ncbi:hypothetical protein [Alicycliphilus denitrificans]|uniref:hypothetical protein n=1 Tax=Alicycliphilus denitrificans TaxID=179636 RepID=UPI00384BA565
MRFAPLILAAALAGTSSLTYGAGPQLPPTEAAAVFKAAGFKPKGQKWFACAEGQVSEVRDINGDGLPEVIITESGTECHGMTGEGYSLVSKQPNGAWKRMSAGTGIPLFLQSRGVGGWPDLQVGGPGFCFPVLRWNGRAYSLHRYEYEGKRCKP